MLGSDDTGGRHFFGVVKNMLSDWRCLSLFSPPAFRSLFLFIWPTSAPHHQGRESKPAAACKAGGSKRPWVEVCGNTDVMVLPPRVALASGPT